MRACTRARVRAWVCARAGVYISYCSVGAMPVVLQKFQEPLVETALYVAFSIAQRTTPTNLAKTMRICSKQRNRYSIHADADIAYHICSLHIRHSKQLTPIYYRWSNCTVYASRSCAFNIFYGDTQPTLLQCQ